MSINMGIAQRVKLKSEISRQLFTKVFGVYVITAILITSYQVVEEFDHTQKNISGEISQIFSTFEPVIIDALWTVNIDSIESIVKGMMKIDIISGIEIVNSNQNKIVSIHSNKHSNNGFESLFLTSKTQQYPFELIIKLDKIDKNKVIGRLVVFSNFESVFKRIKYGVVLLIIFSVIKTLCLWLIFSYFIKKYLADPILSLSQQVENINFDNIKEINIRTSGDNELSSLKASFNDLLIRLDKSSSDLKLAIHKLDKLNAGLEDKVTQRTQALKESMEDISESKKMHALSILVNGVAHEINTPLGVVVTSTSYLFDLAKDINRLYSDENLKKADIENYLSKTMSALSLAEDNTGKITNLVRRFKQLNYNTGEKTSINIGEVVKTVLDSYSSAFINHNISISSDVQVDAIIELDPSIIPHILTTFVDNSINHAFKETNDGDIKISVALDNGALYIHYSDYGSGIGDRDIDKLFDPFYTSDRGSFSGLGLNIIFNLVVNTLAGTITCNDKDGLNFDVSFPVEIVHQKLP